MRSDLRGAGPALAVVAVLAMASAWAADAPIEAVTFDEAVQRAIDNNRDVRRAAASISAAEARLLEARSRIMPVVGIEAGEIFRDQERAFDGSVVVPDNQFSLSGYAYAPVLDAAAWARRAQAAERVGVAELEAVDVRRQVATATAQVYLAVVAAQRQVEIDSRARDNAQAQRDYAQTRFEGGAGSRLNAVRAAEVLATDEVLVERSRLALRLTQEALGVLMAADAPVDAAGAPTLEVPTVVDEADLELRTDLRLLSARRDLATTVLEDSWKDWLPVVVASFDPRFVDPAGAFEDSSTWSATIAASFPIYLGGERKANRLLREADLAVAEIDLDQAGIRARSEVRAARAAIDAAERGLASATLAAEHANEVLRITDLAFRAGSTTNIELVDAQRRARDAETAAARAEDILSLARLDLLDALGLFPGGGTR